MRSSLWESYYCHEHAKNSPIKIHGNRIHSRNIKTQNVVTNLYITSLDTPIYILAVPQIPDLLEQVNAQRTTKERWRIRLQDQAGAISWHESGWSTGEQQKS